jgi:hypothetical protein
MDTDPDPDPGPALFVNGFLDANIKYFFLIFIFLQCLLSVFKDNKSLKITKQLKSVLWVVNPEWFFLIWIWILLSRWFRILHEFFIVFFT